MWINSFKCFSCVWKPDGTLALVFEILLHMFVLRKILIDLGHSINFMTFNLYSEPGQL